MRGWVGLYGRPRPVPLASMLGNTITPPHGLTRVGFLEKKVKEQAEKSKQVSISDTIPIQQSQEVSEEEHDLLKPIIAVERGGVKALAVVESPAGARAGAVELWDGVRPRLWAQPD